MPYPTQHENFYKNQVIQLQQELEQLTETYQYKLNEAGILDRVIRAVALRAEKAARGVGRWGDELAQSRANIEAAEREASQDAATEAASIIAHNVPQTFAERLARFPFMKSDEILRTINAGNADFQAYVLAHYGRIVQSGTTPGGSLIYQRLLPDGTTVLIQNGAGDWIPLNKPGFNTAFGYIGPNGQLLPPGVKPPPMPQPMRNPMQGYLDLLNTHVDDTRSILQSMQGQNPGP